MYSTNSTRIEYSSFGTNFDYNDPSSWDRYQTKMKENLFTMARERDPLVIDRAVEDWLNIARNGSTQQCVSMLSVVDYFYPNKINESYFKSRIQYFCNKLRNITNAKVSEMDVIDSTAVKRTAKKNEANPTPVKTLAKPKTKTTAPVEKDKNFDTEFPTFSDAGFPTTKSNIFDKLLSTEKCLDTTETKDNREASSKE